MKKYFKMIISWVHLGTGFMGYSPERQIFSGTPDNKKKKKIYYQNNRKKHTSDYKMCY